MTSDTKSTLVKVLETDSLTDIALIKSVLDAEGVRYNIQGENMNYIRPLDSAILKVAEKDVKKVVELLKPLKLNYNRLVFGLKKKIGCNFEIKIHKMTVINNTKKVSDRLGKNTQSVGRQNNP